MIKLLTHHVLVKPDNIHEADEAFRRARELGIEVVVDKREQKAVEYGVVVSVGPTAFIDFGREPTVLSIGDRVSFARYSGKTVTDRDGIDYLLLNDQDILCVIV